MAMNKTRLTIGLVATLSVVGSFLATRDASAVPAAQRGAQAAAVPAVGSRTGQQVWSATCANCHLPRQRAGRPAQPPIGPLLAGRAPETEASMRNIIRNGHGTMRGIPAARLADAELPGLITYLRSLRYVR